MGDGVVFTLDGIIGMMDWCSSATADTSTASSPFVAANVAMLVSLGFQTAF